MSISYPNSTAYDVALSDPINSLQSEKLKRAVPMRHPKTNRFISTTGGYSCVYKLLDRSDVYALKCWTAEVAEVGTRYPLFDAHLKRTSLPYFIEFGYEPEGILVGKSLYPTLWMKWAAGDTLCPFLDKYIGRSDLLIAAAQSFRRMTKQLHQHGIAHGDLQDGNIIAELKGNDVSLTLIDYDSMAVPALFGAPASIAGQSSFQSPYRNNMQLMNERMDYFSELVIYLSLRAYAENPGLWCEEQDKQLLFGADDFEWPGRTEVWKKLNAMSPAVRYLADRLSAFSQQSDPYTLQPLEQVLMEYTPASQPVTVPETPKTSDDDWSSFLEGILPEKPAAAPLPAPVLTTLTLNEDQIANVFETLPAQAQKSLQKTNPTTSVTKPPARKPTDGLTVIGWTFAVTTAIAFLLLMVGAVGGGATYLVFIVSGAVLVLTLVIALLRSLFR